MNSILWRPSAAELQDSQIVHFMHYCNQRYQQALQDYSQLHAWSINCPADFWQAVWDFTQVQADTLATRVIKDEDQMPGAQWFVGARLNFAQNVLRYRDDKLAIVFTNENNMQQTYTYAQLHTAVAQLAAGLKAAGVKQGDRVAGFLPNIPHTVIGLLAASSLGAVWSSCSPDFGKQGVVDRLGQIAPKVLLTADGYIFKGQVFDSVQVIKQALPQLPSVEHVVVIPYMHPVPMTPWTEEKWCWYDDFVTSGELNFVALPFDHPLYILYSSGTTGQPKCIVHSAGGSLLQHSKEHRLHVNLQREDVLFYYTTCGWMMWNWLVSALATGCTIVLYDGSPMHPTADILFDVIDQWSVTVFGTSAKYLSSLDKLNISPKNTHQLTRLRSILSTGSVLAPEGFDFVYERIKNELCLSSISGGTDIVSCFALGCPILPVYRGELQCRGLGMAVAFFDETGQAVIGEKGELVCTQPFPSMPVGFWNDPRQEKYQQAYFSRFKGVWTHGDFGELTSHEGVIIYGRSDATLNPGGVRIGTAEIYRQVETIAEVLESLAIGQHWEQDERIILFVKLQPNIALDQALLQRIKTVIKQNTTPRHVPAKIIAVPDFPRTRNGKLTELAVKQVVHGEQVQNVTALANPEALDYFRHLPELALA